MHDSRTLRIWEKKKKMLNPELYYTVYLLIVTIYTIALSNKYSRMPDSRLSNKKVSSNLSSLFLIICLTLFIGLRPKHRAFVDMSNYDTSFAILKGRIFEFNPDATNRIFDNFMYYMATNGYDITVFFFIMAVVYFGGIYISSRKLFPCDTLYAIIIYLGAFSTFSYGTNGIKAGAATAVFLCALGFYKNKILCLLILLASIGIHHSMIMPVVAIIICYYYRNPKVYLLGWLFSLVIALAHITYFQHLFGGMADESGAGYLTLEGVSSYALYITGFRFDFVFYSFFPIASGYYAIFKHGYKSNYYNWIYCTYLLTNAVWMLCMYANFTNRIAYLSWLMLPIVLVYPFFDKQFVTNQYKKLNIVAWGHLGFTIMMEVVYYGLIK